MPFLRRRGNMVSETDMRRHTILETETAPQLPPLPQHFPPQRPQSHHQQQDQLPPPPPSPSRPQSQQHKKQKLDDQPKAIPELKLPFLPPPPLSQLEQGQEQEQEHQGEQPRLSVSISIQEPLPTSLAVPGPSDADNGALSQRNPDDQETRPDTPPIQEETPKHRRFSILRFRNASDSQLSVRAKQQAEKPPPIPRPPEIITTAPTADFQVPQKKQSRMRLADRFRRSGEIPRHSEDGGGRAMTWKSSRRKTGLDEMESRNRPTLVTFEEPDRPASSRAPTNGEHHDVPNLSLPSNRASESSRSDVSSGEHLYVTNATGNSPPVPSGSNFFRLPRRKPKTAAPMFDLSHLPQKGKPSIGTDNPATSSSSLGGPQPTAISTSREGTPRPQQGSRPQSSHSMRANSVASSAHEQSAKPSASPATALFKPGSTNSGQSSPTRARLQRRGRSSTLSSLGRESTDGHLDPGNGRASTSVGRKSFGDLFGLNRLRQNSDLGQGRQGSLTPATPGSNTSKNNSLQIAREAIPLPDRLEDETPVKYLARIEEILSRGVIASALSKGSDPFSIAVLRSYMRRFSFFEYPMDMAIRKLLMEAELPKETQQIDRCLQAFANRYHECNPGIYASPDQAYFVAFSLLILHTDVFNKNNKHKMQQPDYLKNTKGEGVSDSVLSCFYDNITYTPFIHVEDDLDLNSDRLLANRAKRKTIFPGGTPEATARRSNREPLDPYTLIIDGKLDILRPSLKDVMELEDHYNYLGTAKDLNVKELQRTFFRTGVLQIVSARSRPDAFRDDKGSSNPAEAAQGVVDIKITKVGLLWRKDVKKKKTRSPWQEWGAILTGAQLYFFRNTTWIKNLMHQYESHVKQGFDGEPITFKPPLPEFKPDGYLPTKEAVALVDSTYKKHKNAFKYAQPSGYVEEVLLADNEEEMNDWLAKLNYAAAFTTSGVRMRGVVGGNYEGQSRRGIRRLGSSASAQVIQTPTGDVSIVRGKIDHKEAESIHAQRRQTMMDAVAKADEEIALKEQELEGHLRNARHLQILSPIQGKTRDQILSAAAHMDVKIKWTRMDMWKSMCHRDVLLKDLAEEQSLRGLTPTTTPNGREPRETSPSSRERPSIPDAVSSNSVGRRRRRSSAAVSTNQPLRTPQAEPDSPVTEAYQTPPTSATFSPHKYQNSWDSKLSKSTEHAQRQRPGSSSSQSSGEPTFYSPQQHSTQKKGNTAEQPADNDRHDDVDANERALLQQAGLLESGSRGRIPPPERKRTGSFSEPGDASESRDTPGSIDKQDKTKIRRSLQRTLRESAGHLSHHRSRKGKDVISSGGADETSREDVLTRGSGSFVVHGKKASVINFGSELQQLTPEERMRQRKQDEPASPVSIAEDYHDALNSSLEPKERRGSAASASTATARSFRELHRKYSSAHASKAPIFGGRLSVPSDGESEAAVSFSEGRRTPLPPIENESGDEAENEIAADSPHVASPRPTTSPQLIISPQPISAALATPLATPSEPTTPLEAQVDEEGERGAEMQRLPSPPVQAVKA
ncbi:Sec7 domain-containing protein [Colletotrichum orchidophilum]|uniref:Sec7 domain-containing protein n=1 Tax=Colletotrichum orchidophilum TaxID=1209926 RepID=A0A1G4ATC7_9PEZI|nr:Sec7 domain-containing protein [Colletotrichum orchidophilum]OHE92429.1 Sec7 domain-containing protein [Colletotrichum orchidophilum]